MSSRIRKNRVKFSKYTDQILLEIRRLSSETEVASYTITVGSSETEPTSSRVFKRMRHTRRLQQVECGGSKKK